MATQFTYKDKNGKERKGTAYSLKEQSEFHSHRAKNGSINPKTDKPYSDLARARSRGWIKAMKTNANLYNLKKKKISK